MSYSSSEIAFPGLGIGEFTIDRIAFTIFGRPVAWYGLIIGMGMILATLYVMYRTREYKGINSDDIIDYALALITCGIIGARLYYVITSDHHYTFKEIFAIWEGGLAIYGGIIAGFIAAIVTSKLKKKRLQCILDMVAPAVAMAQAIGRWGNFCNGEAYGAATTLPWGMKLTHIYSETYSRYVGIMHPTFLYESLWNIIGFILLNIFYRKRKFDGQIILMYFAWYGFGRMFIEGLRMDSLYVGPIRISQLVGLVSFLIATALIIILWNKAKRYESASTAVVNTDEKENDDNESTLFSSKSNEESDLENKKDE